MKPLHTVFTNVLQFEYQHLEDLVIQNSFEVN